MQTACAYGGLTPKRNMYSPMHGLYTYAGPPRVMGFGAFVGWEWAWIWTMLAWNSVFFTLVFCLQGTNFCLAKFVALSKFLRGSHFWLPVVIHYSRVEIVEVWNGVSMFASGRERIVTDFDLKLGKGFKVKNPHSNKKLWDYLPRGLTTCPRQKPSFALNPIIVLFLTHFLGLEILSFSSEMEQPISSMERIALWGNISDQRQPIRYLETGPGALQ